MTRPALTRILMVEDNPDIQSAARLILESFGGYRVCICGSGLEALNLLRDFMPELILLDVVLPGMDGPSVLEALKNDPDTAAIPVVFMTAKAQAHEVAAYKQLGAVDVIAKPFDPVTLPATIKNIWDGAHV